MHLATAVVKGVRVYPAHCDSPVIVRSSRLCAEVVVQLWPDKDGHCSIEIDVAVGHFEARVGHFRLALGAGAGSLLTGVRKCGVSKAGKRHLVPG
jgi:hypothetical protein